MNANVSLEKRIDTLQSRVSELEKKTQAPIAKEILRKFLLDLLNDEMEEAGESNYYY